MPRRPAVEVLYRDVKNKGKLRVSVVIDRTSNRLRIQLAVRHHARGDASVMPYAASAANYHSFICTQKTETRDSPKSLAARGAKQVDRSRGHLLGGCPIVLPGRTPVDLAERVGFEPTVRF